MLHVGDRVKVRKGVDGYEQYKELAGTVVRLPGTHNGMLYVIVAFLMRDGEKEDIFGVDELALVSIPFVAQKDEDIHSSSQDTSVSL